MAVSDFLVSVEKIVAKMPVHLTGFPKSINNLWAARHVRHVRHVHAEVFDWDWQSLRSSWLLLPLVLVFILLLLRPHYPTAAHIPAHVLARHPVLPGFVCKVPDGDNIRIIHQSGYLQRVLFGSNSSPLSERTIHIRLAGVDAPEAAHFGIPAQPGSQEARRELERMTLNKRVSVKIWKKDQYGRVVGTVFVHPFWPLTWPRWDVSKEMLKKGWACLYREGGVVWGGKQEEYSRAEEWAKRWRRVTALAEPSLAPPAIEGDKTRKRKRELSASESELRRKGVGASDKDEPDVRRKRKKRLEVGGDSMGGSFPVSGERVSGRKKSSTRTGEIRDGGKVQSTTFNGSPFPVSFYADCKENAILNEEERHRQEAEQRKEYTLWLRKLSEAAIEKGLHPDSIWEHVRRETKRWKLGLPPEEPSIPKVKRANRKKSGTKDKEASDARIQQQNLEDPLGDSDLQRGKDRLVDHIVMPASQENHSTIIDTSAKPEWKKEKPAATSMQEISDNVGREVEESSTIRLVQERPIAITDPTVQSHAAGTFVPTDEGLPVPKIEDDVNPHSHKTPLVLGTQPLQDDKLTPVSSHQRPVTTSTSPSQPITPASLCGTSNEVAMNPAVDKKKPPVTKNTPPESEVAKRKRKRRPKFQEQSDQGSEKSREDLREGTKPKQASGEFDIQIVERAPASPPPSGMIKAASDAAEFYLLLKEIADAFRIARKIVVAVGAGISTNAGIPCFRDERSSTNKDVYGGKALYSSFGAEMFDYNMCRMVPGHQARFLQFNAQMHQACQKAQPTKTHRFLKRLDDEGKLLRVYTQNIGECSLHV
ncbi:putative endonuclease lcl3 [Quaeritorhiza haematococci]|nr:putative endonuclease lcl3 [Quaeritorhiza haematococci]